MSGARTAAKEIIAVLAKKPSQARTAERLTGDIRGQDVCKVLDRKVVDRLTPGASTAGRNWSVTNRLNGKVKVASCQWDGNPAPGKGTAYMLATLTVRVSTYEKASRASFESDRKAARTTVAGAGEKGPLTNLPGLGEAAFLQVVESKMGAQHAREGKVTFLTGRRVVEVVYRGSRAAANNPDVDDIGTTALGANVVAEAAESVARTLPARIAGK
jgi:hypothetical protein